MSKDAKAIIHRTHGLLDTSRRFNSALRQKRISEGGNTLRTMWPVINSAHLRKVGTTAAIALRQTTLVQRHMSHTPPPTARYYQAVTFKKEAARPTCYPNASDMHTLVMASASLVSTLTPRPKVPVHIFDHCAAVCSTAAILGR